MSYGEGDVKETIYLSNGDERHGLPWCRVVDHPSHLAI